MEEDELVLVENDQTMSIISTHPERQGTSQMSSDSPNFVQNESHIVPSRTVEREQSFHGFVRRVDMDQGEHTIQQRQMSPGFEAEDQVLTQSDGSSLSKMPLHSGRHPPTCQPRVEPIISPMMSRLSLEQLPHEQRKYYSDPTSNSKPFFKAKHQVSLIIHNN